MARPSADRLVRVRKPRVHITYEVETDGRIVNRELPFVVGVMGDFSGDPTRPLEPLRDRRFVTISRDNFHEVLERMKPGLKLRVKNELQGGDSEIGVNLAFHSMDDFSPGNVARQVEPLRDLLDVRDKLRDLVTGLQRLSEEDLAAMLERIAQQQSEAATDDGESNESKK